MKKLKLGLNFNLILSLFLLFFLFLTIIFSIITENTKKSFYFFESEKKLTDSKISNQNSPSTVRDTHDNEREVIAIGVIRTSGLNEDEKKKLKLNLSNYQVTDLQNENLDKDILGFFLEADDLFSRVYLGKCVKVEGKLLPQWNLILEGFQKNTQYSYKNSVLVPERITPIDMKQCKPYREEFVGINNMVLATFSGILKHSVRLSYDIGYDYKLILDDDYLNKDFSFGEPTYLKEINVTPFNDEVWMEFEKNIGKNVVLEGYYLWGYAETKYLLVHTLK